MRTIIKNAFVVGLMLMAASTTYAQKAILVPSQAFEELATWLTSNDYVTSSTKSNYKDGYIMTYEYSIPEKKAKSIDTYNQALLTSNKMAYASMVKKSGADSREENIGYGENNSKTYSFGTHKDRNYNLQYFRDAKDSTMRYVYALVWYSDGAGNTKGSIFKFYGKDPVIQRAQRASTSLMSGGGYFGGMDSVVVNGQTVKYWKDLARKYSTTEEAPQNSAEFLSQLNNLRAAFKNAKEQYHWSLQSQQRRNLQTGIANKIVKLCKEYKSLLSTEEQKFCSNALIKMKKDTDDDYLQSLLDLTARSVYK